jgi:hypothetical protein
MGKITNIKAHPDHQNLFSVSNTNNSVLLYDSRQNGAIKRFGGPNILSESVDFAGDIMITGSYRNNKEIELFSVSR